MLIAKHRPDHFHLVRLAWMLIVMEHLNLQQKGRWYFLQRPLTLAPMPKQEWDNQALELDDPVAPSCECLSYRPDMP
jgi:hypothetical protein